MFIFGGVMHTFLKIITTILIVLTFSCADTNKVPTKNEHPQGSKGGICYPDFTCDDELTCIDNICEEKVNPCLGVVCDEWKVCNMDNGTCNLRQNRCDRTSECSLGQECNASHYCITPNSQCDGVTCSNQGSCIVNNELPVCICNTGYHADGLSCIQDVDPCLTVTCDEWMQCVEGGCNLKQGRCIQNSNCMGTQICDTNHNCVDPVNPCTGVTCSGFGDCAVTNNNAVCVCDTGYHPDGLNCVEDIDLCVGITCSGFGDCVVNNNITICVCDSGYHANGLTCVQDTNPCSGINCSNHGECAVTNNNAVCVCDDEYHASGLTCIQDANPCAGITCSNQGTCAESNNNPVCVCNTGYHAIDLTCVQDANPCAGVTCSGQGTCAVSNNNPVCICNAGYQANSLNCLDINECTNGTNNCNSNATCTNTAGSFICACNSGYTGNGIICNDVNECSANTDNCNDNATCTNTAGSFTCACNSGYSGNGVTCSDINECTAGTNNCSANAICTNTLGSFTCICKSGYTGNGVTCTDINECTTNTDNCSDNGTCTNTTGSFTCACNSGYTGDGITCSLISLCGNGVLNGDEECDGTNFLFDCADNQAGSTGTVTCNSNCTTNFSACTGPAIGWCSTQWPLSLTVAAGTDSDFIYGQVWSSGITSVAGEPTGITAQLCYTTDSTLATGIICTDSLWNQQVSNSENDEYAIWLNIAQAGTYYYYYQFSNNNGATWYKCDVNDTVTNIDNGTAYHQSEPFNKHTGTLTVTGTSNPQFANNTFTNWTDSTHAANWTANASATVTNDSSAIHLTVTSSQNIYGLTSDFITANSNKPTSITFNMKGSGKISVNVECDINANGSITTTTPNDEQAFYNLSGNTFTNNTANAYNEFNTSGNYQTFTITIGTSLDSKWLNGKNCRLNIKIGKTTAFDASIDNITINY